MSDACLLFFVHIVSFLLPWYQIATLNAQAWMEIYQRSQHHHLQLFTSIVGIGQFEEPSLERVDKAKDASWFVHYQRAEAKQRVNQKSLCHGCHTFGEDIF